MSKELQTKILLLNGNHAAWESNKSKILGKGEPGVEFISDINSEGNNNLTEVKLKIGDGFTPWENLPYVGGDSTKAALEEIEVPKGSDHIQEINNQIPSPNQGDVAIIKEKIESDSTLEVYHYSYTAYVYNDGVWSAMDGNVDAKNVYFKDDLTYTANIGVLSLEDGKTKGTLDTTNKSLEDVIKSILAKTISPTITQPNHVCTLTPLIDTGTYEIGSNITGFSWTCGYTDGKYSFGSQDEAGVVYSADDGAGCEVTGHSCIYKVSDEKSYTSDLQNGTFNFDESDYIQIDKTTSHKYLTSTSAVNWSASPRTPLNNIGEKDGTPCKSNSHTVYPTITLTGYRSSFYYVGTDISTKANGVFLRASGVNMKSNTSNFNKNTYTDGKTKCLHIPQGTKRIALAVPGVHSLTEVKDLGGMGLDVKDNFTTDTALYVEGANGYTSSQYTLFLCENSEGFAEAWYAITIA